MREDGPQSETERRYIAMIRRFIRAVKAGHSRRARALGGEMDRAAEAIGKERAKQLELLVFSERTKAQRPRVS